ncbi:hypothetical protein HDU76_008358 [Blyttiomyces sp. JEL0837]|nr:hypothetical protein HDU76_008358 [Blyttiomyces sp. JEL0837]
MPILFTISVILLAITHQTNALAITNLVNSGATILSSLHLPIIGENAAIWGWAMVASIITRFIIIDPASKKAIVNRFIHQRFLSNYTNNYVVTPNADTLYSSAWLDLRDQPLILHVPDTNGRYYVVPFYDPHNNNFARVGKSTTGTSESYCLITGPNYNITDQDLININSQQSSNNLPSIKSIVQSPSYDVWIILRILAMTNNELPLLRSLQNNFTFTPYSKFFNVSIDTIPGFNPAIPKTPQMPLYPELSGAKHAESIPPQRFWEILSQGVQAYPPTDLIDPVVFDSFRFDGVGLEIGKVLNWTALSDWQREQLTLAIPYAVNDTDILVKELVKLNGGAGNNNGWVMNPKVFAIGDRSAGLQIPSDGKIKLYVSSQAPPTSLNISEANWLPLPNTSTPADFYLMFRAYAPGPDLLNQTYVMPNVTLVV